MTARLSERTLGSLPSGVLKPAYERASVRAGIVHLGVGAFHRAHQAVTIEDRLAAGEIGWGIVGASLQSAATRDALAPQDCLYTVAERGEGGERLRVVGSILALRVAPEHPAALVAALADPAIRIVTLTVTEKAYLRRADGDLDAEHPDIRADLTRQAEPRTAHGFLVEALARRRRAGAPPFAILSCDNLPANGETLHRLLTQFASLRDAGLERHIREHVACPSSMVDRIVPATADADRTRIAASLGVTDAWPVMTEPFTQWVVEDRFPGGRPRLEDSGVTMVDKVAPFEAMKLRLLNGAHSSIAYLGLLLGRETVAEAFADPPVRRFVEGLWAEAIPTLEPTPGLDPAPYTRQLAERFANPALAHRTAQIANDGSQKLPQRIVAAALARLAAGAPAKHLALTLAAWIACVERRGRGLAASAFTDPLDDALARLRPADLAPDEAVRAVFELAGFGKAHSHRPVLETLVTEHLGRLRADATATLAALGGEGMA